MLNLLVVTREPCEKQVGSEPRSTDSALPPCLVRVLLNHVRTHALRHLLKVLEAAPVERAERQHDRAGYTPYALTLTLTLTTTTTLTTTLHPTPYTGTHRGELRVGEEAGAAEREGDASQAEDAWLGLGLGLGLGLRLGLGLELGVGVGLGVGLGLGLGLG